MKNSPRASLRSSMQANKQTNKQAGFSLVELMVSLTIGLVVILFVSSLYIGSKSGSRLQEDNARMQEDGRAAMSLLARNIKQAWFGHPVGYFAGGVKTDFNGQGLAACDLGFQDVKSMNDISCADKGAGSPALQLSFRVENTVDKNVGAGTDCNGQEAKEDGKKNKVAVNRFYLDTKVGEKTPSLYCLGNGNDSVAQPVLANVEKLRFEYGIDTNNDFTADKFVTTADDAKKASPASPGYPANGYPAFKNIVAVSVCMQLVSSNPVTQEKQVYIDCEGKKQTATDLKYRLIMRNVYTVRNSSATSLLKSS